MTLVIDGRTFSPRKNNLVKDNYLSYCLESSNPNESYVNQIGEKALTIIKELSYSPLFKQEGGWSIAIACQIPDRVSRQIQEIFKIIQERSFVNCYALIVSSLWLSSTIAYTISPLLQLVFRTAEIGKTILQVAQVFTIAGNALCLVNSCRDVWGLGSYLVKADPEVNPDVKTLLGENMKFRLIMISRYVCNIAAIALRLGFGATMVPHCALVTTSFAITSVLLLLGARYYMIQQMEFKPIQI